MDSPAAGAATSPLKVHVDSALDPKVILDVVLQTPTSVCRQSLRLITCVRVRYRWFDIRAHLTERNDVDVVCPVKLVVAYNTQSNPCSKLGPLLLGQR